jgi:hypothetical protein
MDLREQDRSRHEVETQLSVGKPQSVRMEYGSPPNRILTYCQDFTVKKFRLVLEQSKWAYPPQLSLPHCATCVLT